ncbi:MBL fold metallo-hydrolase [Sphingobacterium pedocola]|uniref:Exonuclease n=1 Tax=Sphingobacterium pedocola TaxID=2082722 RepID=A0ABR9TCI1_9SPHI|nr:MBL fold metallo-hydrolase [Sphingobacterium pedocola]MBE8722574.1 exonuclease [Sphingobacterium pedocola]
MGEIIADFLVETSKGYYCSYGDFYVDPLMPVQTALISHAHGDHARPGHHHIIATNTTTIFMRHRFAKQELGSYKAIGYNESFFLAEVKITFFPAGHILGSAQILMEYNGTRYLYTGDYKLQGDATCEPFVFVKTDVLITETTFANPNVVHPDPVEEISKLATTNHNMMLGCYSLGKAQRLTHLLNVYCPEKVIYVHHNIAPIHRIYDTHGFVPLKYEIYNRKVMKDGVNKVYLVPPLTFNSYFRAKNVIRVFASGWKRLQHNNDLSLYISDHVDWEDLLQCIEASNPREIWTVHGDGAMLKSYFEGKIVVRNMAKTSTF